MSSVLLGLPVHLFERGERPDAPPLRTDRFQMVDHRTTLAEQASWRRSGGRPEGSERHLPAGDRPGPTFPTAYGPSCYNRFVRWGRIGVRDRIFDAVSAAYDGSEQSVGSSLIRVHRHGANARRGCAKRRNHTGPADVRAGCMERSRGGLTTKIQVVTDAHADPAEIDGGTGA